MRHSESIATLAASLVAAQKEFSPAIKSAVNPQFKSKYVDLASAIEAAQPSLLKNGLAVLQGTSGNVAEQSITVTTRILHSSGEWIEDSLTLPAVNREAFTAQTAGSAITYARRYSYMSILGFAPEDDDGNAASGHNNGAHPQANGAPKPAVRLITSDQANAFRETATKNGWTNEQCKAALKAKGLTTSAQIPESLYALYMGWANKTEEITA